MPLQLGPVPNFNTNIPPMPDQMQKVGEMLQLRALIGQQQFQQQSRPLQLEQEQQQVQASTLANQRTYQELQSQKALQDAITSGSFNKYVGVDTADGTGFDAAGAYQHLVQQGVLPQQASQQVNSFLEIAKSNAEIQKSLAQGGEAKQNIRIKTLDQLADKLGSINDMRAADAGPALDALKQDLVKNPGAYPGLTRMEQAHLYAATLDHLPAVESLLGLEAKIADFHKSKAAATEDEQKVIPPGAAMSPFQQSEINRDFTLAQKKQPLELAKIRAEEAIRDGDPAAAAQLLVNGDVAPSQLVSSRKPAFAQAAFTAAQKLNPNWNSQAAEGYFKTAQSPANTQFFGSAKSLTDQGGTLDQLQAAYNKLPNGRIPALNKISDWTAAAAGGGATAGFAQTALGVADDYAKVMGGGQGSDTSRKEVLDSFARSSSGPQMAAAINAARQAVDSQMSGRIGTNPVMKRMYGDQMLVHVKDPNGGDHIFRTQQQADSFKKAAGIQ